LNPTFSNKLIYNNEKYICVVCRTTELISILHKYLRQNPAAGLHYIIDEIANIEAWEEGKPYLAFGYYMLWTQHKEWQTSLLLTTLTTENLHPLYVIGI
jgi:hypothetical protein